MSGLYKGQGIGDGEMLGLVNGNSVFVTGWEKEEEGEARMTPGSQRWCDTHREGDLEKYHTPGRREPHMYMSYVAQTPSSVRQDGLDHAVVTT